MDGADAVDGHVDRAAVVLEVHEVGGDAAHGQLLEAAVAADAVLVVDDRVALGDLAQIAERRRLAGARLAQRARPEDLLLGDDDQPIGGQHEPAPQRSAQHGQRRARRRANSVVAGARRREVGRQAERAQQRHQALGVRPVGRDDADAVAGVEPARAGDRAAACRCRPRPIHAAPAPRGARLVQLRAQRRVRRRFDADARRRVGRRVDANHLDGAQLEPPPRRQRRRRLVLAQHEVLGGQRQPVLDVAGRGRLAQARRLPARLVDHRLRLLDHAHASSRAGSRTAAPCPRGTPAPAPRCRRTARPPRSARAGGASSTTGTRRRRRRPGCARADRRPRSGWSRAPGGRRPRPAGAASAASPRRRAGSTRPRRRTARCGSGACRWAGRDR